MKKLLLTLLIAFATTVYAQDPSIEFTSTLTEAQIGTTVTIDYKYTVASDGNIYCAINLYDEWTWQSNVVDGSLSPAPAGTDVTGSFQFTIPEGTTETSNLTGNLNYKLVIELSDADWDWLAGDYPATEINLTNEPLSSNQFDKVQALTVYPNPATNHIQIIGLDNAKSAAYQIYNSLGQQVAKSSTLSGDKIDLSYLNAGIYMISVLSENKAQTLKFIKK